MFLFVIANIGFCAAQTDNMISPDIFTDNSKKLYFGYENKLFINFDEVDKSKIIIKPDKGQIKNYENGHFTYIYDSNADAETVIFNIEYEINGKKANTTTEMYIFQAPKPIVIATIAGINSGIIDKQQLLQFPVLLAISFIENFPFEPERFEITSCKVSIVLKGYLTEYYVTGNKLDQQLIDYIKNATSGQKFYFEDINAKGNYGTVKVLNAFVIKIK